MQLPGQERHAVGAQGEQLHGVNGKDRWHCCDATGKQVQRQQPSFCSLRRPLNPCCTAHPTTTTTRNTQKFGDWPLASGASACRLPARQARDLLRPSRQHLSLPPAGIKPRRAGGREGVCRPERVGPAWELGPHSRDSCSWSRRAGPSAGARNPLRGLEGPSLRPPRLEPGEAQGSRGALRGLGSSRE